MSFGIEFLPNMEVEKIVNYSCLAEENGFENIWVTDHYNNRNVYAVLAMIAANTNRIKIGPGVTNSYQIHPAVTASAVATINELSKGRGVLGIGPGDKTTLSKLGIKFEKPAKRLKEAVDIIKGLWAGESVKYDGEFFDINGAKMDFKTEDIPIYIGAQGPVMLKIAGMIGDGVLINASNPKDFEVSIPLCKEGMKEVGREDFDIVAYTCFSIDKESKKAKNAAKIVVGFIVAGSPDIVFERHNIDLEDVKKIREALGRFDFGTLKKSVTDEMLDAFSICGSPEECIEKIEKLYKVGVTQIVAGSPVGPNMETSIKIIGEEILQTKGL
ncbi:5,10-methylenetetrahydromethanopterin reductase [Candidatus Methanoliparum sp. LAM-1]|nr:5,10-methylenetetrahydromethanopterin reductase [Candidatus Methanoliparum sp. LAM-1]